MNITCPRCHHRHPVDRTCEFAKALADEAAMRRAADALPEPTERDERLFTALSNLMRAVQRGNASDELRDALDVAEGVLAEYRRQ